MAALMVVVPEPTVLAVPFALIVATPTSEDDQVTCAVRISVVPSLNVPVAVNCCELPWAIVGLAGVTLMEVKVASVTVNDALDDNPANSAVMIAVPLATPVAKPLVGEALLMVATEAGDEVQLTELVRFCELPS